MTSGENELVARWGRFSRWPAGRRIFGRLVGMAVPYAGTISPEFLEVLPGRVRVRMRDRRGVRNHLRSVHAAALFNLGELAANMALTAAQPADARWIVTGSTIVYEKKARGTLEAVAELEPVDWQTKHEIVGESRIVDAGGDVVARLQMRWLVSPHAGGDRPSA